MKKRKLGGREPVQEIISLNDELFSLVNGDPLALLEQRLGVTGADTCNNFACGSLSGCPGFTCSTFKIP